MRRLRQNEVEEKIYPTGFISLEKTVMLAASNVMDSRNLCSFLREELKFKPSATTHSFLGLFSFSWCGGLIENGPHSQAWWHTSIIPALGEAEAGGSL